MAEVKVQGHRVGPTSYRHLSNTDMHMYFISLLDIGLELVGKKYNQGYIFPDLTEYKSMA